ncbi:MAG: type II toxin-antitoxin system RelE/ParE family toxin [Actinoallomurus sp.]
MGERTRDWDIYLVNEVRDWLEDIRIEDPETFDLIEDAIYALSRSGPALKRPLVGAISGSTIRNLKELRPGSSGRSEIRILFVFDPW